MPRDIPVSNGNLLVNFDANYRIRDIFFPFDFGGIAPAWLSWNNGTAVKLANAAYEERRLPDGVLDPARIGVLADALEDAGCTNDAMLHHCRQSADHVRGCWVVDAILGKS